MTDTFKKPPWWYAKQVAITRQSVLLQHTKPQKLTSQCVILLAETVAELPGQRKIGF